MQFLYYVLLNGKIDSTSNDDTCEKNHRSNERMISLITVELSEKEINEIKLTNIR